METTIIYYSKHHGNTKKSSMPSHQKIRSLSKTPELFTENLYNCSQMAVNFYVI